MHIEVSLGEVVDKLSILDIKLAKINNAENRRYIQKEREALQEGRNSICSFPQSYWYSLLVHVNTQIWELTDTIKELSYEKDSLQFAKISHIIFELNQGRFRLKDRFNKNTASNLQERKSYAEKTLHIRIDSLEQFYRNLDHINKASLSYDSTVFVTEYEKEVKAIYSYFPYSVKKEYSGVSVNLDDLEQAEDIYKFHPIVYITGGKLGDFFLCLSIPNEIFRYTGRKAHLLVSTKGDSFQFGVERAIADVKDILDEQYYIDSVIPFNEQPYNIDLTIWRQSQHILKSTWHTIYTDTYKIPWGITPWISVKKNESLADTVFIHCSKRNTCNNIDTILRDYPKAIFISQHEDDYVYFIQKYNCPYIQIKKIESFYEMAQVIQSCKLFICNLTMQYALANAIHKQSICMLSGMLDDIHNEGMINIWPHTVYYRSS